MKPNQLLVVALTILPWMVACGGSGKKSTKGTPLTGTAWTFRLEASPPNLPLWTTPAVRRLRESDRPPSMDAPALVASAARGEYEIVQLAVGPGEGTASIAQPESGTLLEHIALYRGGYVQGRTERMTPLAWGERVRAERHAPVVLWLVFRVARSAPAGVQMIPLTITTDAGPLTIPLNLHVFDFELPREIHYESLLYLSISSLMGPGEGEQDVKDRLFDLRMTPSSVAWPSGLGYRITWDSGANPQRCEAFYDEPDEALAWSVGHLAPKYMRGEGWNGVGFPMSMFFQFVDNSTPRPSEFCGVSRGDHFGTASYNAHWASYLTALSAYLQDAGLLDRGYWYVQNEPQNQADYDIAAALCRQSRAAAPDLKIAISEEPKPQIAEHADGACMYDLWIAHIRALEPGYAATALRQGARLWLYTLDHDPDPWFNPTRTDADGLHMRIIPWASWTQRATGWAYYDFGRFFHGPHPSVMAHLFREGSEDYEYLRLAAGGQDPTIDMETPADVTARSVASSLTSWARDPDAFMSVRHELGRYIEGSRSDPPQLEAPGVRPRGAYCVNFQNPSGRPTDPVVINGISCEKVGWMPHDDEAGMGWYGQYIGNSSIALTGYDEVSGVSEALRSYVYDDYGRENLFEFSLAPGRYRVTVGAGRPARAYPNDPHHVTVEGIPLIHDEPTTDSARTFERSCEVDLTDGSLSIVAGGRSATTGDFAYTFLSYLLIEPLP